MASFGVSSSVAAIVTSFHKSAVALKVLQENRAEKSRLRKRGKSDTEQNVLEIDLANSLDQGSERMRSYYNYYYAKHGEAFAVGDHTAQLRFNEIKEDAKCLYRLFEFAKKLDLEDTRKLRNMADKYQHETQLAMMDLQTRILTHQCSKEPVGSSDASHGNPPSPETSSKRDQGSKYQDKLAAGQSPTKRSHDTNVPPPPTYFASSHQSSPAHSNLLQLLKTGSAPVEEETDTHVHPGLRNQSLSDSDRGTEMSDPSFSSLTTPPSSIDDDSPISRQQSGLSGGKKLSSIETIPELPPLAKPLVNLDPEASKVSENNEESFSLGATDRSTGTAFAKSRSCSAASENNQDLSSSNETINSNLQPNNELKQTSSRDSKSSPKAENTKPVKLRNDFCSGALKIQTDPLRHLIVSRRPVASYSFANYYGCPRRGCFFEGPMHGAGSNRHMDNTVHTAKCGIRYRWVFLAKSHAPLPSDMRKGKGKGRHGYKCLICHLEGCVSEDVFEGSERLMQHIREEHTQMMYHEVQRSVNCVFARYPNEGEQFDLCIPPPNQVPPSSVEEVSASRIADSRDIPTVPQEDTAFEASSTEPQIPVEPVMPNESDKSQEQDSEEFVDLSKAPEVDLLRQLLDACRSPTRVELPEANSHEHEHPLTSTVRDQTRSASPPISSSPQQPRSPTRGRYRSTSKTESAFDERNSNSLSRPNTRGESIPQDRYVTTGQEKNRGTKHPSAKSAYRVTNPDREEVSDGYASRVRTNDDDSLLSKDVENTLSIATL